MTKMRASLTFAVLPRCFLQVLMCLTIVMICQFCMAVSLLNLDKGNIINMHVM